MHSLKELGLTDKKIATLNKSGIYSKEGLLYTAPKKYLYFNEIYSLDDTDILREKMDKEEPVAFLGTVVRVDNEYKKEKNISLIKIRVKENKSERLLYLNFLGMYNMMAYFNSCLEKQVIVGGKLGFNADFNCYSMLNPILFSTNIGDNKKIHSVYKKYKGISEEFYEKSLKEASEDIVDDYLLPEIRDKYHLLSYKDTIKNLHFPENRDLIEAANKRVVFDSLLYFASILKEQSDESNKKSSYVLNNIDKTKNIISNLPFTLTDGQKNAINQMYLKAKKGERISSLVQGDVGTGKTIVAFSMMFMMAESNYQSVLMAPTTVLAKQHYKELKELSDKYGFTCVLLTTELKAKEKREVLHLIETGEADFIVGTHSCISPSVNYFNLGLAITDEEHKFGVIQRDSLVSRFKNGMHSILMSGTPIPRTLATSIYGDSVSVYSLDLPANRKPIQTAICKSDKTIFEWMHKEINKGHQCYVVCPLIDKADEEGKMAGVSSVEETVNKYNRYFNPLGIKTAVLTGETKKEDIPAIMDAFKKNETQILIATTEIEVGVNNPNATVITITGAERFGLATLHQLRGRVGRGSLQSYCILQPSNTPVTKKNKVSNIEILCHETDGLMIAKEDMKNRGMGNLIGLEQSGRNEYVELMLTYPNLFEKIKDISASLNASYRRKYIETFEDFYEKAI